MDGKWKHKNYLRTSFKIQMTNTLVNFSEVCTWQRSTLSTTN